MTVYLDNAATANPKAPGVGEAMLRALGDCNGNPGHGAHRLAARALLEVYAARAALADLLGVDDPARLVFTGGATAALNQAIIGCLAEEPRAAHVRPGGPGHVICSPWEHNAVLRPLWAWQARTGGAVTVLPPGTGGAVSPLDVERALRPDTRLIVLTAASNVTGVLQPVVEVGEIARRHGVRFLVDGAQAAGHLPTALGRMPLDLWACPGHKGLLGPQGIGLLYVAPGVDLPPLLLGGAGFDSARRDPPDEMPERFEAGTLNTPGILGLGAAARHLLGQDLVAQREREVSMQARLCDGLRRIPGARVYAASNPWQGVGVASCTFAGWRPAALAEALDARFDVCVRSGLHCAPLAHEALGTAPEGTVRLSTGPCSEIHDIDAAVVALDWLARHPDTAAVGRPEPGNGLR
jgi:cysteine desulfurase/selenocysteine lyase